MKSIIVENLSKKYNINKTRNWKVNNSIRKNLWNFIGNPLRFIGQEEEIWALKNISFSVDQGETLGIIGHNGSGKTTLLKILSQVTPPTSGKAVLTGRAASILEIGIGFHPELTGRENIYLSGALLGFSKEEIENEMNNIIDFSGIKKFIDTPVRFYSSGMYARLAFSIVASINLNPDILLLDEILAVGDARFYEKSIERISQLINKLNTTVLLVSHNLPTVRKMCRRCLWLENGELKAIGESNKIISGYLNSLKDFHKSN